MIFEHMSIKFFQKTSKNTRHNKARDSIFSISLHKNLNTRGLRAAWVVTQYHSTIEPTCVVIVCADYDDRFSNAECWLFFPTYTRNNKNKFNKASILFFFLRFKEVHILCFGLGILIVVWNELAFTAENFLQRYTCAHIYFFVKICNFGKI